MISVVYSTREDKQKYKDYLIKTSGIKNIEILQYINNGEFSLSEIYNKGLKESSNNVVIFLHDDIEYDTLNWGKKILKHFNDNPNFGILGVAGTTEIPKSGQWWEDRRKMIGIVNHKHDGKKWESKYSKSWGDNVNECCFVDGLFIAVNKTKLTDTFDETVKGFHYYDVHFCVNNFLKGTKIGVIYNVRLTHLSIGQTNEKWDENRKLFVEKYENNLPLKSDINLSYEIKEFKFLKKYNLRIIINSGSDFDKLKETLEKIKTFNIPNYKISLIVNENIKEEVSTLQDVNITLYDGYFDELSKNLSVLKWDTDFINEKDDLIFFIDKDVKLINNIFSSFTKLYHSEKGNFGCAFPSVINEDKSIFSTQFNFTINPNNQVNIMLQNNGSFYNLLDGYKENKCGNFSNVFVTNYNMLKSNDWFDIGYDTNITFNDYAIKCFLKNRKIYIDTDSLTITENLNINESFNKDLSKLLQQMGSNEKTKKLILQTNG